MKRRGGIYITCHKCGRSTQIPVRVLREALVCSFCGLSLAEKETPPPPPFELTREDKVFLWGKNVETWNEPPSRTAEYFLSRLTDREKRLLKKYGIKVD